MKTAQETSRVLTTKSTSKASLPDMEGWLEFSRCAEEVGIESVLMSFSRYEPDTLVIAAALGQATRNSHGGALPIVKEMLQYGISPRAYHHLLAMARAAAFMGGRDFVSPADVKYIAPDVMHHRLGRTIRAEVEGVSTDEIVAEVLRRTPIP